MSFKYSYTFPLNGPNKLPRFREWAASNVPDLPISLPPQVPVKASSLTVRLKSAEDRDKLLEKIAGAAI